MAKFQPGVLNQFVLTCGCLLYHMHNTDTQISPLVSELQRFDDRQMKLQMYIKGSDGCHDHIVDIEN